jgi:hypothetical protein
VKTVYFQPIRMRTYTSTMPLADVHMHQNKIKRTCAEFHDKDAQEIPPQCRSPIRLVELSPKYTGKDTKGLNF